MHLRRIYVLGMVLAASTVFAQSLDPGTQILLDHAKADRDSFGAGSSRGFTLEDQLIKAGGDRYHVTLFVDRFLYPDNGDTTLLGTERGAEIFLDRKLETSDIVVTGKIVNQTSILNTHKTGIVTDSLLIADQVLHTKPGLDVRPGSSIIISRQGGRVHIDGREVIQDVDDFPSFVAGQRYLLFLQRSANRTDSYVLEPDDALALDGDSVRGINTKRTHPAASYLHSAQSLMERIRNRSSELSRK